MFHFNNFVSSLNRIFRHLRALAGHNGTHPGRWHGRIDIRITPISAALARTDVGCVLLPRVYGVSWFRCRGSSRSRPRAGSITERCQKIFHQPGRMLRVGFLFQKVGLFLGICHMEVF